jgi:hypothetical protein
MLHPSPIHFGFVRRSIRRTAPGLRAGTIGAIAWLGTFRFGPFFRIVRIAFEALESY